MVSAYVCMSCIWIDILLTTIPLLMPGLLLHHERWTSEVVNEHAQSDRFLSDRAHPAFRSNAGARHTKVASGQERWIA